MQISRSVNQLYPFFESIRISHTLTERLLIALYFLKLLQIGPCLFMFQSFFFFL